MPSVRARMEAPSSVASGEFLEGNEESAPDTESVNDFKIVEIEDSDPGSRSSDAMVSDARVSRL